MVEDETLPFDERFGPRVGACPKCGDDKDEFKKYVPGHYVQDFAAVIVWACGGCGYRRATPTLDAAAVTP